MNIMPKENGQVTEIPEFVFLHINMEQIISTS